MYLNFFTSLSSSQHNHTHAAHESLVCLHLFVDAACNGSGTIVVDVIVKLTVTSTKFLFLEEKWVVEKGKSVENVKLVLQKCQY